MRLTDLARLFGGRSPLARLLIPQIVVALRQNDGVGTIPAPPQLIQKYGIDPADQALLLPALRQYYAAVILAITAFRCGTPPSWDDVCSGAFFRQQHVLNLLDEQITFSAVDFAPLLEKAARLRFDRPQTDVLRPLYNSLFPGALRHEGGEYYTPDWLVEYAVNSTGYDGTQSLLDPACGSGAFLLHAIRQSSLDWQGVCGRVAGVDRNPLACLSARANLLLLLGKPDHDVMIPIFCADSLLDHPPIGQFAIVIGNPPWINWETLAGDYRQQTRTLWEKYGLFAHRGMDVILGKSKKDLSALMTVVWADRYLCDQGQISVILTETTLKSSAAAGFRNLQFGEMALQLQQVDDFSQMRIFKGANTHTVMLTLQKGIVTCYPVAYRFWSAHGRLRDSDTLNMIRNKTERHELLAEPIGGQGSPLAAAKRGALDALHRFRGESGYRGHAGVYTGGANAVYWLEILEEKGMLTRVRNLVAGAKRSIPEREAWIESALLYPLLRSGDVVRWSSAPSAAILMVQDVEKRQGYDPAWLRQHYPHAYQWLQQFESELRSRAAFQRYFTASAPFYSMFDVGRYSFSPHKVVWQGMGAYRMQAAVQEPFAGKPVMSNQAVQPFIAVGDADEAHYLAACLNSPLFEFAVICHGQAGGKSFAQPGILQHLYIPLFDRSQRDHQEMVYQSRCAHAGQCDADGLLAASAAVWGLLDHEVRDVLESLIILSKA